MRQLNGVPVAIIGQAFPYTPIAHPRRFVADWTFGIREEELQRCVNDARAQGAVIVALLSHNGMDVDLKLASRVTGIDVILGGHTHDAVPQPILVKNASGTTVVTNAGSNGKFLGVLDLALDKGKVDWYMVTYANAVHAFTNPDADSFKIPGIAYNEKAARRSWKEMQDFFGEQFKR
jgi:sulfur-oxidizing protein SoxB